MKKTFQHPSEQTYRAIDGARDEFAKTRGVCLNAIDQLMAGNTKDPYPPFREHFQEVCATPGTNPDAYLSDLHMILQRFRPQVSKNVRDAFLDKLSNVHDVIETLSRALGDGELDKDECNDVIPKLSKTRDTLEELYRSVLTRKNVLSGAILPNEILKKAQGRNGNR